MTAYDLKPLPAAPAVVPPTPTLVQAAATASVPLVLPWALLAIGGLVYLSWGGSSWDPRKMALWYTKPDGWFSLAPSLGHFLAAWLMVFYALTMLAFRAMRAELKSHVWQGVVAGFIFVVALDVRLAVVRNWMSMVLDPVVLAGRAYHPAVTGRGWAVLADLATLAILLLALYAQRRNLWLAALFAFHPLVIVESAANGSGISMWMPLLALLVMGWRLHRWLREVLIVSAGALFTWWMAHVALQVLGPHGPTHPFTGFAADLLSVCHLDGRPAALVLIVLEALLQGAIAWQALRHGWGLARVLGQMFVAWAILAPNVMPGDVVPVVMLLVLEWNTAGWILSGAVVGIYLMLGLYTRGEPWVMPGWLVILVILPAMVILPEDWVRQWALRREKRVAPATPSGSRPEAAAPA